jgi:hypothetical protein
MNDVQTFVVTGTNSFPTDMLRYDHCWPATELDSQMIDKPRRTGDPVKRSIRLAGRMNPTVGRWESFGWTVEVI